MAVLNVRVRKLLELVNKAMPSLSASETFDADVHHALARAAAGESVVLLKNEGGLLPLAAEAKIAVIGEFARTPRFQGAGSSQVNPTRVDTALGELEKVFGSVVFAPGYEIGATDVNGPNLADAVRPPRTRTPPSCSSACPRRMSPRASTVPT